ncbi:hypothetical protein SAMN05720354_102137 [Nitrosospira sp. Nsp1]|nr:hypothetical protein SAMN05720354_102137 [Nitrosospira sp. Nsp1]
MVFGVQGKAQRRGMRPRRAKQCLPQEGATPKRDAGAPLRVERDRGIPCAARSPLREAPSGDASGRRSIPRSCNAAMCRKTVQFTP